MNYSSFLFIIIEIQERHWFNVNWAPLHRASDNDSSKIGALLIAKGADINIVDLIYKTIIVIFFIIKIHIKERKLIKKKRTALHWCASYDSIKLGELLVSKGANLTLKDFFYQNIQL